MKSFFTFSFGCRVNEAEKEEIDRKMVLSNFVFDPKKPDIYIINTCSVTQKAEREARQLIYHVKNKLPKSKIVVTGCSATYWIKNKLHKDLQIDLLVDNINKEFLVDLIKKRLSEQPTSDRGGLAAGKAGRERVDNKDTNKFIGSGRTMIKIQDGCQRYCSFCIVPYLRGVPKSYKIKSLVAKVNNIASSSPPTGGPIPHSVKVSEVILTAINTEAYGYDTKEKFTDLLRSVINNTKVPRISLGSLHPWSIHSDFFDFYRKYLSKKRLVNFFHVPVQSGSNKILALMKRGYKAEEILEKLQTIKKINPLAFIATDVIVGFLEETDRDFEDTYNFLKQAPISKFHVFRFSKRSKTAADYMTKRLKEPTASDKARRSIALIELGKLKYFEFLKSNLGRTSTALFLEKKMGEYSEGLLDNQLPVLVPIPPGRWNEAGSIKNIKIIDYKNGRLFGKIV